MSSKLSPNTEAILLLTAPLITGSGQASLNILTPGEYRRLARRLHELGRRPADLLSAEAGERLKECGAEVDAARVTRLLERGFQLSQAVERWQARAIWVISRTDPEYPTRLNARLKTDAPPILYGCGQKQALEGGGLAVVGSRNVEEALIQYAEQIGQLTAEARQTIISGGARGIDQAAMRGALQAGGMVVGVLADSLERAALNRENRTMLVDGRLALISPYDPGAGFNVGNAMQRNKLIYALADAALVVNSDYQKGGTWTGAVEQLDKYKFVRIYVRSTGELGQGIEALRKKGALPWPNPADAQALLQVLASPAIPEVSQPIPPAQTELPLTVQEPPAEQAYATPLAPEEQPVADIPPAQQADERAVTDAPHIETTPVPEPDPAEMLYAAVRQILSRLLIQPHKEAEVAAKLQVTQPQAREWLQRLVDEGVLEKQSRPVRYVVKSSGLFEQDVLQPLDEQEAHDAGGQPHPGGTTP